MPGFVLTTVQVFEGIVERQILNPSSSIRVNRLRLFSSSRQILKTLMEEIVRGDPKDIRLDMLWQRNVYHRPNLFLDSLGTFLPQKSVCLIVLRKLSGKKSLSLLFIKRYFRLVWLEHVQGSFLKILPTGAPQGAFKKCPFCL